MSVKQRRKIEGILQVEEIHDIIDIGATMPVRCRLENGMNVVVKYMKNPFGQQVLINEFIGSCIADKIDLTIPEYGICDLSADVIFDTNDNEDIDERNAGLAFYTKDYSSSVPPIKAMLSLVKNKETEKIILFDHVVNNCDRHKGNLLLDISKSGVLYVIDNSHIIVDGINGSVEQELDSNVIFSKKVLEKNRDVYDILCTGIGYNENKLISEAKKIQESITSDILNDIKNSIPRVWLESIEIGKIDKMFEVIKRRVAGIDKISELIIDERRK